MPLKASYLLLAGAGGIVVYSGLKGWSISKAARDIISGQNPNVKPTLANTISSAQAANSYGYGGQGAINNFNAKTGPITSPVGPGETAWFTALLVAIVAPPSAANLASLHDWRTHESVWNAYPPDGAQYTHNPLNTTLATGSVTGSVNSVGVKIYANAAAGIAATAMTLLGGYPSIVSALRRGVGLSTGDPGVSAELSKWSGGGYSAV